MKNIVYALLVGIDAYQGAVPKLNGCVNDVKRVLEYLQERTRGGDFELDWRMLTAGDKTNPAEIKPTRQNVIDSFRSHLSKAKEGDVALFYYSGHGSQEKAPPQFWHLEPDHLDETLVCMDSRLPGSWDLADKELSLLIAEVAKNNPHILVILDACHSGSGTRAAEDTTIRLAPLDARDRPLDTFLPGVVPAVEEARSGRLEPEGGWSQAEGWYNLPTGRHVVISACRAEESAREKAMPNGEVHGILTYSLLDTIQQTGPMPSYREIFGRIDCMVRNNVTNQNPVIASTEAEDMDRPFLGGAIPETLPYYTVNYEKDLGWVLQAGAIQGIAAPAGKETTRLALFPRGYTIQEHDLVENAVGQASVLEVRPGKSKLKLEMAAGKRADPEKDSFRAVVIATPLTPVLVHLDGDDKSAIRSLNARLKKSKIVQPTEEAATAALRVIANKGQDSFYLKRAGDLQPLNVPVKGKGSEAGLVEAQAKLEHMAQWIQVLQLDNKQSRLPADSIKMELARYIPAKDGQPARSEPLTDPSRTEVSYAADAEEAYALLQIHLTHTGKYPRKLFCMLVNLTEDFGISAGDALFGGGEWLDPGQDYWATNKEDNEKYIYTWIPEELRKKGVTQVRDVFKLIVSTDPSDANLLAQDSLEVVTDDATRGAGKAATRGVTAPSTLDRLMHRIQTRAAGTRPESKAALSDWYTRQVTVTTKVVGGGAPIPKQRGESAELTPELKIQSHPSLNASARLEGFESGKRDLGNLALPAVLRSFPDLAQPFEFQPSRGGDAGSSVIVLEGVDNPGCVTPQEPLIIETSARLGEDEAILPIAYDPQSELFLPLGLGVSSGKDGTEIRIERLPAPTGETRDVAGSIKMFFQKVVASKIKLGELGLEDNLARLAAATVGANGQVMYDNSPVTLIEKVKKAQRILLFIHGFTGDTRNMVRAAFGVSQTNGVPAAPPASDQPAAAEKGAALPRLADQYDLILAFDYENINTSIEETAAKLKKQLINVGLTANHGKTLHIVAHSLGTMVTRYFIERDNGSQFVQQAVLVGPPNAGTPWATLQEYALFGLTAALNGLAAVIWPPSAIPTLITTAVGLIGGVEKIDTTMDELKPDSSFYKVLNASDDPGVPYVVVAGNTSKIVYQQERKEAEQALMKRIAEKVTSPQTRNRLLSLAFLDQPNDMAISLQSMVSIPAGRKLPPKYIEVACDHISYFTTPVGMEKVLEAIGQP